MRTNIRAFLALALAVFTAAVMIYFFDLQREISMPLRPVVRGGPKAETPLPPPEPRTIEQCERDYDSSRHQALIPGYYSSSQIEIIAYRLGPEELISAELRRKQMFHRMPVLEIRKCRGTCADKLIRILNSAASYSDCLCFCTGTGGMGLKIITQESPIEVWVEAFFHKMYVEPDRTLGLSREGTKLLTSIHNDLFPDHAFESSLE
ncbi:hypothetical protein L0156_20350 [bacterium]|nr:hypothetical protein [bacterium]